MFADIDLDRIEKSPYLTEEAKLLIRPRTDLWIRTQYDERQRAAALKCCRDGTPDMPGYLFFFYYFLWIYEERNPVGFKKLPFVPYPFQIEELRVMYAAIQAGLGVAGDPIVVLWLKSREMGMTWLVLAMFLWYWLFHQGIFHVGSRNEMETDYLGRTGTLYFKLRFMLGMLPEWMRLTLCPDLEDKKLLLSYNSGEVSISGESANPQFGTGQRKTAMLLDEFSKWEHDWSAYRSASQTSNVLFIVGTPFGFGNMYAQMARQTVNIDAEIRRVHWTLHPLKTVDLEYVDGKPTSSWYRKKCSKLTDDMIGGELDLSFESSQKGLVFASLYGVGNQKTDLLALPGVPLVRAWDPGGIAACILFQVDRWRRVRVLKEVVLEGLTLGAFADAVVAATDELCEKLRSHSVVDYGPPEMKLLTTEDCGDPSGATMTKMNQTVPEYEELAGEPWNIHVEYMFMATMPAPLRERARIVAIEQLLRRRIASGNQEIDGAALWVDINEAPYLHEALLGGYRRKTDDAGNVKDEIAERRPYNDVIDAFGYGVIYKLGVPELLRREIPKKTEEQLEDDEGENELVPRRRSRC